MLRIGHIGPEEEVLGRFEPDLFLLAVFLGDVGLGEDEVCREEEHERLVAFLYVIRAE